jgi:AcrR family transcriptional regulator
MPRPRLDHVRKAQILSAAAEVMSERGYANVRLADIATAAGTSPAAILYWFSGKDELLAEALRLREQQFHDTYTVKAEHQTTASAKLRVLVQAMLHHYDWPLWMELCVLALRDRSAAAERDRLDRRIHRRRRRGSDVRAGCLARRSSPAVGGEGEGCHPRTGRAGVARRSSAVARAGVRRTAAQAPTLTVRTAPWG